MTGLPRIKTGFTPGRIQKWIRPIVIVIALAAISLRATTFKVTLDKDTIQLGDIATLSLTFDGANINGAPQLPNLPGLQVVSSGQSSQLGFSTGGKATSTTTFSFGVKATEVGEFSIPSLSLKLGNETLTSEAVKFKITRPTPPIPGSDAEQQSLALLRIVLPKKEIFAGETIVIEQQLLVRKEGVSGVDGLDVPPLQLDGCTTAKAVQGPQRQIVVGSTPFILVPFYVPVTAMKTGPIQVGPVDGNVVVRIPSRGRDPFEGFGFFNSGVQQRIALSAPEQTLTVLPLPEAGKPISFSGAVGSYKMEVSAGPTNVGVGDPITIRVQVSGRGALDAFTLPDQAAWKEFKTYPPTVKTETEGDLALQGKKSFEQIVVPQNTEIKELPPFDFAFFNPDTRRYETLHQAALPIVVHPTGATPAPTIAAGRSAPETQKPTADIVHIKPRMGTLSHGSTPWVKQTWFIALQSLPVFALVGAFFWRKRIDSLENNPRLRRKKQTEQIIADGLEQLPPLAAAGKAGEFFATVFRLMQEQIGERLNVPASGITEAVVHDKLRARGLGDGGADVLHELFQLCNQARYAPVESAQKLEAVIPKLKMALRDLQEVKG